MIRYIILLIPFIACNHKPVLFEQQSSGKTGIHFNNTIIENDSINPLDLTNVYNGGGIGVGDFNNDGLQDLYFTGNLVSNKMYLNKGDFEFEEVTAKAGVTGEGRWCRGVAVVDINNDGWQDLYVCATIKKERQNLLYINNHDGTFTDKAAAWGLNDTSHSTMAAFFDYDNDGDQDVYIAVNEMHEDYNPSVFRPKVKDGSHFSVGRLYRNNGNETFSNVTAEAGVTMEGFAHAVSIVDINKDGWKDIYVTNDFLPNDLLYINNHDGTFTDKAASYFKHTSYYGMGNDVMDINNDGLADIIELDMNPEDNYRKKMMLPGNSYLMNQNSDYYGYQYQYIRNTLQLNAGARDTTGDPVFTDIGFFAGVAETDWSWCPLLQDFDNDGYRDLLITNGYPKDLTDHDFIAFRQQSTSLAKKDFLLKQIPQVKIHNYAYKNNGGCRFSNVTEDWGLTKPSFSNGAAYADLDNDGDLDYVVNNINDEAFVYRNTTTGNNWLRVDAKPGVWVELYYGGQQQVMEVSTVRGYLSSVQGGAHFGLGSVKVVDSVCIKWPGGKMEVMKQVKANQVIKAGVPDVQYTWAKPVARALFTKLGSIDYTQQEADFVDFNIQRLLPHKFSEAGPALAAGDVDGNGFDDLVCGGSEGYATMLFLQNAAGRFVSRSLPASTTDNMGVLLFDADNDKDLDLYIASGGYEHRSYADLFYINDGKGNFTATPMPADSISKSCVRAFDYDKDGDLDLLVAGRVAPARYPQPVNSFLYTNDGHGKFSQAPFFAALVNDVLCTDFDNDGWTDVVLAGEWMPLTFLKNNGGMFTKVFESEAGWWNSMVPGDFDNDGDMDYVAGNLGLNSFYRAPVQIYAKDFDNNGSYDAIPSLLLPASLEKPVRKEFIAHMRDDVVKQVVGFRKKYADYKSYARAGFAEMFTAEEMKGVLKLQATNFSHCLVRNHGKGQFTLEPLPVPAQFSCLNGMLAEDFNGDGAIDLLVDGNDFGTEAFVGRYDGCNGLLLLGDGKGGFAPQSFLSSGIFIPGNGRSLVQLRGALGQYLVAASQNRGALQLYALNRSVTCEPVAADRVVLQQKNGHRQLRELNYGSSYLSQSSRFVLIDSNSVLLRE